MYIIVFAIPVVAAKAMQYELTPCLYKTKLLPAESFTGMDPSDMLTNNLDRNQQYKNETGAKTGEGYHNFVQQLEQT